VFLSTYDKQADAAYYRLMPEGTPVRRTVQLDSGTTVDLTGGDEVVGVEVINPVRFWPVEVVLAQFRGRPQDLAVLRAMRDAQATVLNVAATTTLMAPANASEVTTIDAPAAATTAA
jgi:uncharacterized protein YuzE